MSRNPGTLARLWQRIRQSIEISRVPETFVGQDHLGNKYYEVLKDAVKGKRASRTLKALDPDPNHPPEVPPEWDSWLRRRRQEPPTQEEIDNNYAMMLMRQAKGREKEIADRSDAEISYEEGNVHRPQSTAKSKFPIYSEYEQVPGVRDGKEDR